MKLFVEPLAVDETDGFKNDGLQRKQFGEALASLVTATTDELVVSLDGQWGEGKTTFVKMWQGLLKESNVPSIYIDAFQNDHTDDAFISIAGAITSYVNQHIPGQQDSAFSKDFTEKAKKVGVRLLAWSAKMGVKAATLGVINAADLDDFLEDVGKDAATDASDVMGEFIEAKLSTHDKAVAVIQSFKDVLSELPKQLTNNGSDRLVVIIDELDRCRPTFAVEVLEKIKHLFSVRNVVFLLVMHKQQMEEAIRCVYGSGIDAHTYLQKFISVETSIPKRLHGRNNNDLQSYARKLWQAHELKEVDTGGETVDYMVSLAKHFNLSLRQMEKAFTNLVISCSAAGDRAIGFAAVRCFVSVLKVVNPVAFENLRLKRITFSGLCSQLSFKGGEEEDEWPLTIAVGWVHLCLLPELEFDEIGEGHFLAAHKKEWARRSYFRQREDLLPAICDTLNLVTVG